MRQKSSKCSILNHPATLSAFALGLALCASGCIAESNDAPEDAEASSGGRAGSTAEPPDSPASGRANTDTTPPDTTTPDDTTPPDGSSDPDPGTDPGTDPDPGADPDPDPDPGTDPDPDAESICADEAGAPIPYDYSIGLVTEYAAELAFNCDVGGFMEPIVAQDPIELSGVNAFVLELTDWYRARILRCADTETNLPATAYPMVPISQGEGMSSADFDKTVELFMTVLDRHDELPDAVSANKKDKLNKRLKAHKKDAVNNDSMELTRLSSAPECAPPEPPGGGAGGAPG